MMKPRSDTGSLASRPAVAAGPRYRTAVAALSVVAANNVLDMTPDDFEFVTSSRLWISTDRNRARRCIEAMVYGALDYCGYPRFPAPAEFVAAVIARYVNGINIQTACLIMEGCEFTDSVIEGVERPLSAPLLFSHTLQLLSGDHRLLDVADSQFQFQGAMHG